MGDDSERKPPHDEEGPDRGNAPQLDVSPQVLDELASIKGMGARRPVDRGPSPRALSQARIQVKSDTEAPRVRSSKLRSLRRVRTGPRPLLELETPDSESAGENAARPPVSGTAPLLPRVEDSEETQAATPLPETAKAPVRRRLLAPLQVASVLLLLETALLPSLRAKELISPWSAWTDPASPNFVAIAFLALLGIFFAFPVSRFLRTGLHALVAGLIVMFSLVLLRSALAAGTFDGQPALHALFADGLMGGLVVVLAVCVLPTALFWWHAVPDSRRARVTATVGVGMMLFSYLGLQVLVSLEATPLGLLIGAGSTGAFAGDRIAAWLAWLPLIGALASLVVWMPGDRVTIAAPLGLLVWSTAILPLVVLALYVAPWARWHDVLLPLQVVNLFAAGTLLLAGCLSHLLAVGEMGEA